jgi:DNA-binding transcriptional LysR family regulator
MYPTERLKGIETFVCAADAGSFTAAAERLSLTNSAVGKTIARLEARLGVRLFHRTTRSLALTDEGAAYYQTCTRILGDLQEAEAVLAVRRKKPAGRLRIDLPTSFGRLHVMPLLLELGGRYPDLRLHVSFTDRFVDLAEEGIDITIRIGGSDLMPAGLVSHALGHERVIFCASPAYLRKHGKPKTPDDLAAHDCVVYGAPDGRVAPWLFKDEVQGIMRKTMPGRVVAGSIEAVADAAVAGCGVAQLATWLVKQRLEEGTLVEILGPWATHGLAVHLVWLRSRQLLPKVHAVIELLSKRLAVD